MQFTFEILDEEFEDLCYGVRDLKDLVVNRASEELVKRIYDSLSCDAREIGSQVIKNNTQEIIDKVISLVTDRVAASIVRKKEILEITPKASELAATDKANEKYFMDLIDRAIAKRFK